MIRITRPNLAAWVVLAVGVGLVLVGLSFEVEAALVPADQSGGSSSGLWVVAVLPLGVGALFVCLGGWLLTSARRYAKLVRRLLAAGVATSREGHRQRRERAMDPRQPPTEAALRIHRQRRSDTRRAERLDAARGRTPVEASDDGRGALRPRSTRSFRLVRKQRRRLTVLTNVRLPVLFRL